MIAGCIEKCKLDLQVEPHKNAISRHEMDCLAGLAQAACNTPTGSRQRHIWGQAMMLCGHTW